MTMCMATVTVMELTQEAAEVATDIVMVVVTIRLMARTPQKMAITVAALTCMGCISTYWQIHWEAWA